MQGDFQDAPPEKLGNILIHLSGPDTRGAQSCINQVQKPQCALLSTLLNTGFVRFTFSHQSALFENAEFTLLAALTYGLTWPRLGLHSACG